MEPTPVSPPLPPPREDRSASSTPAEGSPIPSAHESLRRLPSESSESIASRDVAIRPPNPRISALYDKIVKNPKSSKDLLNEISKDEFCELILMLISSPSEEKSATSILARFVTHSSFDLLDETDLLKIFMAASKLYHEKSTSDPSLDYFIRKLLSLPQFLGEGGERTIAFINKLEESDFKDLVRNLFTLAPSFFPKTKKQFLSTFPQFETFTPEDIHTFLFEVFSSSKDALEIFLPRHSEAIKSSIKKLKITEIFHLLKRSVADSNEKLVQLILSELKEKGSHEFINRVGKILLQETSTRKKYEALLLKWVEEIIDLHMEDPGFLTKMAFHQTFNGLTGPEIDSMKDLEGWSAIFTYAYELRSIREYIATLNPLDHESEIEQLRKVETQLKDASLFSILAQDLKGESQKILGEILSEKFDEMETGETVFTPLSITFPSQQGHSFSVEITKTSEGKFRAIIFNLSHLPGSSIRTDPKTGKYYPLVCDELSKDQLEALIKGLSTGFGMCEHEGFKDLEDFDFYEAFAAKLAPYVSISFDPSTISLRSVKGQSAVGICTHKSLSLWLHQKLPEDLYRGFKIFSQNRTIQAFDDALNFRRSIMRDGATKTKLEVLLDFVANEEKATKMLRVIDIAQDETLYTFEKSVPDFSLLSIKSCVKILKRNFWNEEILTRTLASESLHQILPSDLKDLLLCCAKQKNLEAITSLRDLRQFEEAEALIFTKTCAISSLSDKELISMSDRELLDTLVLSIYFNKISAQALLSRVIHYLTEEEIRALLEHSELCHFTRGADLLNHRLKQLAKPSSSSTWISWITGRGS